MELAFVNLSGPPSDLTTKDAKKVVRSHAMLHYRHQQRLHQAPPPRERPIPLPKRNRPLMPNRPPQIGHMVNEEDDDVAPNRQEENAAGNQLRGRRQEIDRYPISPTQRSNFTIFHHCELKPWHKQNYNTIF